MAGRKGKRSYKGKKSDIRRKRISHATRQNPRGTTSFCISQHVLFLRLDQHHSIISFKKDMQIKISHLAEQLKQVEPIGLPQGKKVENCPCSRTPKIQKSTGHYLRKLTLYFGIFLWLLDRLLLSTDRLCIALVLFSKHGPEPTWLDWILNGIFHQHNRSYLWPH
ncbi:uncharacterized protein AAGF69_008549 isoform 3-T4 [Amazona ochrocephala]